MEIIDEIRLLLGTRTLKSGTAFYSCSTTLKKGRFLIVGLNPGGDPEEITNTIEDSFNSFKNPSYNAYYENWFDNGRIHRLQQNLQALFKYLEADLRTVCSTNLFYERTKTEKELSISFFPVYKSIIEKIIGIVEPEVIFTFGRKPFRTIFELFEPKVNTIQIPSGHGNWKIELCTAKYQNRTIKIVGLPHLSIYTLYNRPDQLENLKKFTASP